MKLKDFLELCFTFLFWSEFLGSDVIFPGAFSVSSGEIQFHRSRKMQEIKPYWYFVNESLTLHTL